MCLQRQGIWGGWDVWGVCLVDEVRLDEGCGSMWGTSKCHKLNENIQLHKFLFYALTGSAACCGSVAAGHATRNIPATAHQLEDYSRLLADARISSYF